MQADEVQNAKRFRTQKSRSQPKLTFPDRLLVQAEWNSHGTDGASHCRLNQVVLTCVRTASILERFCKSRRGLASRHSVFHRVKHFRRGHMVDQTDLEQVALACAHGKGILIDETLNAARQNPDNTG